MPVTAKLSRKFYEKLGDDIATELVEWFNLVDATYRSDLRELNEANFVRFDAKLEQRLAEMGARTITALAETRAEMAAGFARADAKLEQRLAETKADLRQEIARVEQRLGETKSELLKWMFRFWLGSVAANAALIVAVIGLLRR